MLVAFINARATTTIAETTPVTPPPAPPYVPPKAPALAELLARNVPERYRDTSHWMHDGRADCWVHHKSPVSAGETVNWLGVCSEGFAQGRGTIIWSKNGRETQRDEVTLDHGLRHGVGVLRFPDGEVYRDRYSHGDRVERKKIAP